MTEQEWLGCEDPKPMLGFLWRKASNRKFRLFACACCRRVWHLLPDDCNRDLVAAIEDYPDGSLDDPQLKAAISSSSRLESELGEDDLFWGVKNLGRSFYKLTPIDSAVHAVFRISKRLADQAADERAAQAALLRCIFANPFRPTAPLDASRLTQRVVGLARDIYDSRSFERMRELADTLEEAGCRDQDILDHCRNGKSHVRGCWVVDLLLGKQ